MNRIRIPSLLRPVLRPLAPLCMGALLALPVALAAPAASAAEEAHFDAWPTAKANDIPSLQRGARLFVNYCLNCHSASLMRWNRLHDIGLDDAQIKEQLIFGDQKVGDMMSITMSARDAKAWFGKAPPDLSVIIRGRSTEEHAGTDYVYTLLRSFYRDPATLTSWNNKVYPNIAMPNILWQVQATDLAAGPEGEKKFDGDVADLVAFLNWMSEPGASTRYRIGVWVMGFLFVFLLAARWLNKQFWKDIS